MTYLPTTIIDSVKVLKPEEKWEDKDRQLDTLNTKIMNDLVSGLSRCGNS